MPDQIESQSDAWKFDECSPDENQELRLALDNERATLSVIGGKWKPGIIRALQLEELRYGVLLRRMSGASRKVLTDQLRELRQDKIVARTASGKRSERVEYSLTPYGRTLIPVLDVLAAWGEIHLKIDKFERANPKL